MIRWAASEGFWAVLEWVVVLGSCLAAAGASGLGVNRLPETNYLVARGGESHLGCTGMKGHDLPTVIKLLEVHGGVPDHLLLGTWERDRPPGESQREVWLK